MKLIVEDCGPGTTLQDAGRVGWRRYGVSTSGAMDLLRLAVANRLAGNPADAPAIEFTLAGGRFRVDGGETLVAAAGPRLAIMGRDVPSGRSVRVADGDVLIVSPIRDGVYGYLAVAGGIRGAAEMGSYSTHRRSGIGWAPLAGGMAVPVAASNALARELPHPQAAAGPIRIMAGPQDDWFESAALDLLKQAEWRIAPRSDRMGVFLEGAALCSPKASLVSDGVLPGSIQVPPSGQPIVMMRDCQTTGGYPKIATVISADLSRLAQLRPGSLLRFRQVARAEAIDALAAFRRRIDNLHPRAALRHPDSALLLSENLVSGVWGRTD